MLDPSKVAEISKQIKALRALVEEATGSKLVGRSKIYWDDVRDILISDKDDRELAKQYGVTPARIWQVRNGYNIPKTHKKDAVQQ